MWQMLLLMVTPYDPVLMERVVKAINSVLSTLVLIGIRGPFYQITVDVYIGLKSVRTEPNTERDKRSASIVEQDGLVIFDLTIWGMSVPSNFAIVMVTVVVR